MDASDVVGLARVATCSRALHDLFSDGAVRASLERSRVASNRANISEGHLRDLRGMLYEVAAQRDAALEEVDNAWGECDAAVAFGLRVARVATEARRERDEARRERDEALGELAKAKRAHTS